MTLFADLPRADGSGAVDEDAVYEVFASWCAGRGITPYPAQDEAFLELLTGNHVILSTPTGSGKSLVALAAHATALARGQRTYYTAPVKALVSEKFFALCEVFGPENVGMLTGDASVNPTAPVVCCTAEILANQALRQGEAADIGQVVMDEFHFYAEPDRGWAWQVPLIELASTQFLLMSATLGDVSFLAKDLTRRTGRETVIVSSMQRPVPLHFSWAETPLHETLAELLAIGEAPVYVVHFTQAAALERAQALTSVNVATREQRDRIADLVGAFRFGPGFGRTLSRLVRHGIGVHHAGMLPKYRRLVETLAQAGLLKVICGTDTLGVGINVPIRTVVLTALTKYDGRRQRVLKAREFHQIAGRAGRAGYDTSGSVVVQAPDHVVENAKALAKAGDDPKKLRRVQRKKPPEGFVTWTESTFRRLVDAEPEPLVSRMRITHSMMLNVIARGDDPLPALRRLLRDNHEPGPRQVRLVRRAVAIYRSLLAAGVVSQEALPGGGRRVRLVAELQDGFALNQALSTYALATFEVLDPEVPTYPLDVVSVIEATLEDPRPVLLAQQFQARGEAVAEMKSEGVDYEERMELLEDVSWPKPLEQLLEHTYALYARTHPWILETPLSPKSVARDMFEQAMTFAEYVAAYGLARSEGLVLRYLSDCYRALRQTVPDSVRSPELDDLVEWLGTVVRQTDSSLLDEWEALSHPGTVPLPPDPLEPPRPPRLTSQPRAFRVLVRNALFRRVELAALGRAADLEELDGPDAGWRAGLAEYAVEHDSIGTGPDARGPGLFLVEERPGEWRVQQILDDPEGHHDWRIVAVVDLGASDEAGELILRDVRLARL